MDENLHRGHRERMRAEYQRVGLPSEPHKRLEMLLYHVRPQVDTNKIAHRLVREFGSFQDVLDADVHELMKVEGCGKATAEYLHFIGDIAKAYNEPPAAKPGIPLNTQELMVGFVHERLFGKKSECILAVFLDAKGRLIHESLAKDAAESSARVENSVRVLIALAMRHNAATVFIGHNHPKGNPMP